MRRRREGPREIHSDKVDKFSIIHLTPIRTPAAASTMSHAAPPLSIRTFPFPSSAETSATSPLTLSLARKGPLYILIHSYLTSTDNTKERQHSIINALVANDLMPLPSEEGRVRIWLKVGVHERSDEPGGENWGLLNVLEQAGVVRE